MYEYRCKIVKVVDGDTVDVDIDLGFGMWMHAERVRLYNIDTPESRTSDKIEKYFGLLAKEHVERFLPVDSYAVLKTEYDATGKYGRVLGTFIVDGTNVNEWLVENNHAVLYQGQNKDEIAQDHLNNYKKLISRDPGYMVLIENSSKKSSEEIRKYING
jgi:micrococcal nuclease